MNATMTLGAGRSSCALRPVRPGKTLTIHTAQRRRPISVRAAYTKDVEEPSVEENKPPAGSPVKSAPPLTATDAAPPPGGQLLGSEEPNVPPNWLDDKYWNEGPEEYAVLRVMREWGAALSVSGTDNDDENPESSNAIGVAIDKFALYAMVAFLPVYAYLMWKVFNDPSL
eukprot:CAMPEP_0118932808 /NCGR_PEP_ID=MMETSP1169-20130426/10631_1 /TAXON_ID=36882 /ORGANISM="Pyramimonas obovata, Strain CCMP722" /LENGTH=169 /DNA_ID=CAMNT_0006875509 /DNA_START=109 /DNA_END=618 /DNA_ORIENTATION=-